MTDKPWPSLRSRLSRLPHPPWVLWEQPTAFIVYFLTVEAAALAVFATSIPNATIGSDDLLRAAALIVAALAHAEGSRGIERVRRLSDPVAHVDLNSVWTLPAALLLPFPLAASVIVIIYFHRWLRINRQDPYRRVFSTAMFVLTAYAASLIVSASPVNGLFAEGSDRSLLSVAVLLAAGLGYATSNILLITVMIWVRQASSTPIRAAIGRPADNTLEAATLCFGAFVAVAVAYQPLLVVFALPLVLVLHRNVLIRQLRDDARTDQKTGLRNATAWNEHAGRQLARARRQQGRLHVLLLDIDWFKSVNDTYGHLAGDEVLRALAGALHDEIRETDAVGRFGGEEFVVVLPDTTTDETYGVAERIRERVSAMRVPVTSTQNGGGDPTDTVITGLTVSVGVSSFPKHGDDLDTLVFAADTALYTAKNNGRDQIQLAP